MAIGAKSAYNADMEDDSRTEREGECIDERDRRALEQYLSVLDDLGRARGADDLYMVVSESGSEYLVDVRGAGSCECPDATYRDVTCKHQRRVKFATGLRPVPAGIDPADVDDQLGVHVDGEPEFAAADEGRTLATDGGVAMMPDAGDAGDDVQEDSDDRPADCDCWSPDSDLPCWPCYRAGFETPNPNAGEDN